MKSPIEMMLDGVTWRAVEDGPALMGDGDNLPHVTHEGVLNLMGYNIRCFRLSNGEAVFQAEDFQDFMNGWFSEDWKPDPK